MTLWSAHVSMLFREMPYLQRPAAAAGAGFMAVESWWPPGGLGDAWAAEIARLGLAVTLLNADGGDIESGERGFINDPARAGEAVASFRSAVRLARRAGCDKVNLLVGRERADEDRGMQLRRVEAVVAECAAIAEAEQVLILIEPINASDVPGYLVSTAADAVRLIEAVSSPRVRLLYDAYHAARSGRDPTRDVAAWAPFIGHVQYADCPGRGAPGTGRVDLRRFVEALRDAGYGGAIGLEFDPGGPTLAALRGVPALAAGASR